MSNYQAKSSPAEVIEFIKGQVAVVCGSEQDIRIYK